MKTLRRPASTAYLDYAALVAAATLTFMTVMSALMSSPARAEEWPARPVRIVVPYPPGGAVDVVTRRMAAKLQDQLGQSVFVENKPGAAGTIGVTQVAKAPADGYTLVANDTTWALLPHIFQKLPFDYERDLQPISAFVFAPMGLVVRGDSKYQTLADLVTDAKTAPEKVSYGSGGAGTAPHFIGEAFAVATAAKFLHVPFKGAGEATLGMLSGTVDFQFASTPGVMGNVKSGKARVLAVSGDHRALGLPDVPTFAEAGLKDFGLVNFTGLWAPRETPPAIVERLQKEIATAMASGDMKSFAESISSEPGYRDAATFSRDLAERTAYWGKIADNAAFQRQVIVDNRPGASGSIGAASVAAAPPDGYTLLLDATSFSVNPSLYPKLPYRTADAFAPISQIMQVPLLLVVPASSPYASVADLVEAARANPGKLTYASAGTGGALVTSETMKWADVIRTGDIKVE